MGSFNDKRGPDPSGGGRSAGPPGGERLTAQSPEFGELLSRYFDDELPPELALQVETCLQEEPEALEAFERLTSTRDLLRSAYKEELEQVDFGAMWSGIEKGIANIEPSKAPVTAGPGLVDRVLSWWRSLGMSPLGMGVAAAAAVLLTVVVMGPDTHPEGEVAANAGPTQAPEAAGGTVEQTPVQVAEVTKASPDAVITEGTEVNDVAGGKDATVMVISSPENATIIWVNEQEGQGGSSI